MIPQLQSLNKVLLLFGIDLKKLVTSVRELPFFFRTLRELKRQAGRDSLMFPFGALMPCLEDRFAESGTARGPYFHQDLLVARRIFENHPETHVDIGSRVDGFVAHVASFRPIVVIDVRRVESTVRNIRFVQLDIMKGLTSSFVDCCDSLSSLHALEHFGLGRYGDTIQFDGYLAGLENMHKMLRRRGKLYLSVPIGAQRIEFNAHRVFDIGYFLTLFSKRYELNSFSYVDDTGDLYENVRLDEKNAASNFGCRFGCGIFELTKL